MIIASRLTAVIVFVVAAHIAQAQTYTASGNRIEETSFREATTSATDDVPLDTEFLVRLRSTSIVGDAPSFDVVSDLAMLSSEVYRNDHETVSYFVRGLGFDRFATITNDRQNLMVHVMSAPGVTLVVFRGTDDGLDWLANLDLRTKRYSQGVFHLGFVNAFEAVQADTRAFISQQSEQRIWITGHSLGGSMAVLCGLDQKLDGNISADVITFGQPRIADAEGCRSIDAALAGHYVRVARPTDVVTRAPPALPFLTAFGHAGLHIRLGDKELAIGRSENRALTRAFMRPDQCGNICMVESVSTIYGSPFDEPPITLEELQALPSQPLQSDLKATDGQMFGSGPSTVAWIAFKYAIKKALAWIIEQHSMGVRSA